jgi:hypothetical protein
MFYDRASRNHPAWDALVWGAKDAAADPALADDDDEPHCSTCNDERELTTDGPLGHVMRKPCWDCRGDW